MKTKQAPDVDLTTEEVLSHMEFGLWTAVLLIPILYYVNGPSVSNDQGIMRSILVGVAYSGAPAMRWYRRRRENRFWVLRNDDSTVSEGDSSQ